MTSSRKHGVPKRSPSKHRTTLAAYMEAKRHLLSIDPPRAKPVRQIAAETGMSIRTVRHWLERDHFDEWFGWWPSFAAIVADVRSDRAPNKPPRPIQLPYSLSEATPPPKTCGTPTLTTMANLGDANHLRHDPYARDYPGTRPRGDA